MGLLSGSSIGSPIQKHEIQAANDLFWVTGELETLGNPHNYINQEGLDLLRISSANAAPWSFSGLPASQPPMIMMMRERTQFLAFTQEASLKDFRVAPNTEVMVIHLPLAIIRGAAPLLSEAKAHNFLDFWKGLFFPVVDAEIYFLADCAAQLPDQSRVVYVNRRIMQSYIPG